jgi:hypothetical protein
LFPALIKTDDADTLGGDDGSPVRFGTGLVIGGGENLHQGRFAAAVAAKQTEPRTRSEGDVKVAEQGYSPEPFGETGGHQQFFGFALGPIKAMPTWPILRFLVRTSPSSS